MDKVEQSTCKDSFVKTTPYFETEVLSRRPYIQLAWIERVLANPVKTEVQANGRISRWAVIPEFGGRVLRVITEPDRETVHNAYPDRNFLRRLQNGLEP